MDTEQGSMPGPGTPLIARERELSELRDALRAGHRLITLSGPGGTGKSRLSIALALDVVPGFGGGAWFVDLTGLREAHVLLSAIARTLGVQESGNQALFETLQEVLRRQPTLLVLDNFEHLMDAAGGVASLLAACHTLVVIVTSREALGVRLEQVFPVSTLAVPDLAAHTANDLDSVAPAVALFAERAAARRRGFALTAQNYPAVAEICARLDGLPLAIELAAAQVAMLSPETVLRRLVDRAPFLVGGPRDLPVRHQTLDAAVAWSYELLTPTQQAVFRWCGVFVGGATIEAVSAVCPADDALGSIVQLGAKSLLQVIDTGSDLPRLRMLETIRTYAAELLRVNGEWAPACRRHAEYYVQLGEGLQPNLRGSGMAGALARLALEYDNVWTVLEWASDTDHLELGLRMATALYRFWHLRGILVERTLGRARARLSEPIFAAAWARGRALRMPAAIEFGLSTDHASSGDGASASSGGGSLSAREMEVAQLIALGRTNREIGEALVLSSKTVESHIKHIFAKLGMQARTEVAVWASQQGLAQPSGSL